MRLYETVYIFDAALDEAAINQKLERYHELVIGKEGEVTSVDHWGARQLAYPIEHETRGNYMHLRFRCEGTAIDKMDNEFRLDHRVLRHLVVVDEEWKERNEANRAKRRAARAAAHAAATAAPAPEAAPAGDES